MPKRVKTPPPPDDEPRYLTVVHPYPLNANLMLHADRRKLALWLACCTGKDVLLAMYHKPTSPGMVIIEVDRDFEQFDKLLGKHEWSKFLLKPTGEEADKTSKVFWCHYNSGRLVQKHGWKRVDIEEHWFTNWRPNNDVISSPYPKTTYCEVPSEAKTGVPLCRPLPQAQFPVPLPVPEPRVGSAEWTYAKSSGTASVTTSSSGRGRGKMAGPSDTVSMISSTGASSSYSRAVQPPQPPAAPPVPAQQMASYRAKQGAWSRGPPSTASTSITSPPASRAPSTIGSGQGSRAHSARAPANTPGLTTEYRRLDWAADVERNEAGQDDEPTTPSASTSSFNLSSGVYQAPRRRAPDPEGPIDPDKEYEYQDDRPKRSTLLAMKEAFDSAAMADNGDNLPPATWGIGDNGITEDDPNPWNGYKETKQEPPTKVNRKGPDREEWKCPDHGPMCNPGICKERASIEFKRRDAKEIEERKEKTRLREEKRERKKLKNERKLARAEGTHDQPPHLTDRDGSRNEDEYPPPAGSDPEDWLGNRPPLNHDEGTQGFSPSFPSDDGHSFKSGWTTSTNAKKDNIPRGTPADRQPPADTRSVAASVRSAVSSGWSLSDAPTGAQPSVPGQRDSGRDIRSAASLRSTAPSISNDGSSSPAQRQRSGKPRSPSVNTTTSSVVSERPTGAYAASVSQSSSGTGKRPPERDSCSSTTLQSTPPSTRGKRSTGTDKNSQDIAEWCEKASVSCGSTNAPSVISSRPSTPTETRSVVSSRPSTPTETHSVVSSRPSTPTEAHSVVSSRPSTPTETRSVVSSRPSALTEERSVARSSTSARTVVSTNSSDPTEGGLPTFDNTEWGDPIAFSRHQRRQASGRSHSEKDAELESDDSAVVETEKKGNQSSQNAGSGKKYRVRTKRKAKPTSKMAYDSQEDSLSVAFGVKLEPGGPGSSWGDANVEW